MTMEEFDTKVSAVADRYVEELKRIADEFSKGLEVASEGADGLPTHLVKASIARAMQKIEALIEKQ